MKKYILAVLLVGTVSTAYAFNEGEFTDWLGTNWSHHGHGHGHDGQQTHRCGSQNVNCPWNTSNSQYH
jgi:hypothetical protein